MSSLWTLIVGVVAVVGVDSRMVRTDPAESPQQHRTFIHVGDEQFIFATSVFADSKSAPNTPSSDTRIRCDSFKMIAEKAAGGRVRQMLELSGNVEIYGHDCLVHADQVRLNLSDGLFRIEAFDGKQATLWRMNAKNGAVSRVDAARMEFSPLRGFLRIGSRTQVLSESATPR